MSLPSSFLSSTFKCCIYHRTHISHMCIDCMCSLIQQHGTPQMFLFPQFDIPSFFRLPKFSSHSHSASTFMSRPFFSHINGPFILVHLTGGGNDHSILMSGLGKESHGWQCYPSMSSWPLKMFRAFLHGC